MQLRHLEKKPLVVDSLTMRHIGYDGIRFLGQPAADSPAVPAVVGAASSAAPTNTVSRSSSSDRPVGGSFKSAVRSASDDYSEFVELSQSEPTTPFVPSDAQRLDALKKQSEQLNTAGMRSAFCTVISCHLT